LWRVGNGQNVRIWEDGWLPHQYGRKLWSPKPSGSNIHLVPELIHEDYGGWNAHLVNEFLLPFEAQQILQIPVFPSQQQDFHLGGETKWRVYG